MEEGLSYQIGYWLGKIVAAGLVGFMLGVIPFYFASRKDQYTLGIIALVICAGAGFQFELVGALIACVACTLAVIFLVKPKETPRDAATSGVAMAQLEPTKPYDRERSRTVDTVSYTHLTLPTTPYV